MQTLRIAYAGTPDFAVPALKSLIQSHHNLVVVITQPDRKSGRGRKITQSAVKNAVSSENVQILQPENINSEESLNTLRMMNLDIMIVAAFGQIFTMDLLNLPKLGCINIHASLLPKWRGASPIQHAILSGDEMSGVTIMQMSKEMDAGDIWEQYQCKIDDHDTAKCLHDKLSVLAGDTILGALDKVSTKDVLPAPQEDKRVSYCKKLKKEHGHIQWEETASIIERKVRAFSPWPGTYTFFNSKRIRVTKVNKPIAMNHSKIPGSVLEFGKEGILVAAGKDAVLITELIPEGGKRIKALDFANANQLENGVFGK